MNGLQQRAAGERIRRFALPVLKGLPSPPMDVELLYFHECPNWRVADRHLVTLAAELGGFTVKYHTVDTPEEAERVGFRGSPTVLVNGQDPFSTAADPVGGLSCRMYETPGGPAGSPTLEQLREALISAG